MMGTLAHLLHSTTLPPPTLAPKPAAFSSSTRSTHLSSPRTIPSASIRITAKFSKRHNYKQLSLVTACSLSSSPSPADSQSKSLLSLPIPFLDLSRLTPLTVVKWSAAVSLAVFAARKTASTLLSPFFWTYFSWTWLFWPWILAISLAAYGLYSLRNHSLGRASTFQQLAIVTSAITWLTLAPPAHFNGFLEGWPIALFFVYHYFFFFESSVRRRLYGDLYPRSHDPKWDVSLPVPVRAAFAALVLIGHWLAAYEGPELHLISGGWANVATWVLVLATLFMRYHSVLYLAKYSEKVVVPQAVVQFGPYRWVRHPIYASMIMLFALHCITLRAPLSLLYLTAVCVWYYGRKAELEEALMVENFGEAYTEYATKVRYKLIPVVY